MDELTLLAAEQDKGERLDQWLCARLDGMTRAAVQKLCAQGLVRIAEKPIAKNYKLRGGEEVAVTLPAPQTLDVLPQNLPLEIVYEDEELLVVNKPKGMVVHPAPGNYDGTLVNALLYHCEGRLSSINGVIRPGIVHRIDKDTSGLLMVAKTDFSHQHLAAQIAAHSFTRLYNAVVYGSLSETEGLVDAPIGRSSQDRMKMCVTRQNAREAQTEYRLIEELCGFSNLELRLRTGRTHQIRVHMAYMGHPVAGDAVYGPKKVITRLGGQCLHARTIGFIHPRTEVYMEFTSELPPYYRDFLHSLHATRPQAF